MTVQKEKSLVVEVLNGHGAGPEGSYLFYGVPEGITIVRGRVRFTTNYECKGERIDYWFMGKASSTFSDGDNTYSGKHVMCEERWQLAVNKPDKIRKISPGQYEASFEISLPSTLPPSSSNSYGGVSYILKARLVRYWSLNVTVLKEVWFLPTLLRAPTQGPTLTMATSAGLWKNALPYSITFPSDVLHLGQTVPVRIRLEKFLPTSQVAGRGYKLFKPMLRLKQYASLKTKAEAETAHLRKVSVVEMQLRHWPQTEVLEFQDTVLLTLPMMPNLTPTTDTPVYAVRHSVNLMLEILVPGLGGMMKVKVKVQITGPRPPGEQITYLTQGKLEQQLLEVKG
ncbi:hypothetical protein BGZ72_010267 [Mortierella alpina]|nr:hypothetical protein BGZ72_010267 [Mortierella alpina]